MKRGTSRLLGGVLPRAANEVCLAIDFGKKAFLDLNTHVKNVT